MDAALIHSNVALVVHTRRILNMSKSPPEILIKLTLKCHRIIIIDNQLVMQ